MDEETDLPGMAALVMPCWICSLLSERIVHTPEGLKLFHHFGFGAVCDVCLEMLKYLEDTQHD